MNNKLSGFQISRNGKKALPKCDDIKKERALTPSSTATSYLFFLVAVWVYFSIALVAPSISDWITPNLA